MLDIIVCCISCRCTFSFVLMCVVIFYFANRSRLAFVFDLNLNRFVIYKRFENRKVFSFLFLSPHAAHTSLPDNLATLRGRH
jgi:hypothetical protein